MRRSLQHSDVTCGRLDADTPCATCRPCRRRGSRPIADQIRLTSHIVHRRSSRGVVFGSVDIELDQRRAHRDRLPRLGVKDRDGAGKGFTHKMGDRVRVSSEKLGVLENIVATCDQAPPWKFGVLELMRNLAGRGLMGVSA